MRMLLLEISRRALFATLITVAPVIAFCQTRRADSLLTYLYDRAAGLMETGRYDEAQCAFDSAFSIPGMKESSIYPILLNEQATLQIYQGKHEEGMRNKIRMLDYLPEIDDLEKHVSVYNDLAILYRRKQMHDSCFYYYNRALDVALRYKDESWIAHVYNNVAVAHFNLRHFDKADMYIDKSIEHIVLADDLLAEFSTWQIRAAIKSEVNKLEEAKKSIDKAWSIAEQSGDNADNWKLRCIPSLTKLFIRQNQTDSLRYYLNVGDELLAQIPEESIEGLGFIQCKASSLMYLKDYKEALKTLVFLRSLSAGTEAYSMLTSIAQCYHAIGNLPQAYLYMDSARMWSDTLSQRKLTRQMAEFDVKYETKEKEYQIAQLEQKQLRHEANQLKMGVLIVVLALLFVLTFMRMMYKKKINKKKFELLTKEKELVSSQRYIEGLEAECKHLAKELHDGIANDLLGLQMRMSTMSGNEEQKELIQMVSKLRNNVRNISHELMPPEFENLCLDQILAQYTNKLKRNSQVEAVYYPTRQNGTQNIPARTAYELYRIVQEVTSNIIKHTDAKHINIYLMVTENSFLELKITDDGTRTASKCQDSNGGIGLRTLKERIHSIKGTVQMEQNSFIVTLQTYMYDS